MMPSFNTRKDNPKVAASTPSPVAEANRKRWNERWLKFSDEAKNWRRFSFLCLAGMAYFAHDDVNQAKGVKVKPYVIAVDNLGNRSAAGFVPPAGAPTPNDYKGQIQDFIHDMRTVYADGPAMKDNFNIAHAWLDANGQAMQVFDRWFFQNVDTRMSAREYTISVSINSTYYKGGNSWEVDWTEQKVKLNGDLEGLPQPYYAVFGAKYQEPTTEKEIQNNNRGIWFETLEWGDLRGNGSS
jgi:type IV secretory pathway TrbF-like protein